MIAIVRIKGSVKLRRDIEETLNRLRLKRKHVCVVLNPTNENLGMLKKVKDFVAYGEIKKETFEKLIEKRAQLIDKNKKVDLKKALEGITSGKEYKEFNLKPFFRLSPPRGGIDIKKGFGDKKGVLGDNKDKINTLIERML
ncbi:uL30 family ribosomal protein [Candidatus Pacearchaeota archaeon]|nr:uL30 family ribosomal protein [Candidatus Pacearchaeota archaeon]